MVLHSLINLFSFQFRHIIKGALLKMELAYDLFIIPFRVLLCSFSFFILLHQYSENLGARINKDHPMVFQKIPKPTAPAKVKDEKRNQLHCIFTFRGLFCMTDLLQFPSV